MLLQRTNARLPFYDYYIGTKEAVWPAEPKGIIALFMGLLRGFYEKKIKYFLTKK
jgi:hypothetical protein